MTDPKKSFYEEITGTIEDIEDNDPRIERLKKLIRLHKKEKKCECPYNDPQVLQWLTNEGFSIGRQMKKEEIWCSSCKNVTSSNDIYDSDYEECNSSRGCPEVQFNEVIYIYWI